MSELKKYKLGDVAQVIGGGTPSTTKEEYWNGEIGWLTPRDLTGYSYKYISKGERNITEEGLKNSSARLIPEGTVLMTSRAPIGYLAIAGKELCTNQGFKSFIVDEDKINNEYLYYLLKSNIDRIKSLGMGSTFAEVSASILKSFEIEIPDLPTQKEIASILSSLDDKIEHNLQMNQTLEAMAQAIFKEWFVNFNFPGFDGELVDGLPKGWRKEPIDKSIEFLNGLALQKYPPLSDDDFLPVIKIRELRQGVTNSSDKASTQIPEKYVIENGDILFSWSGSLEVVMWCNGQGALNQHLFKVSSEKYPKWFYYYWTKYFLPKYQATASDKATTMGHIQRRHLTESIINVPDFDLLNIANDILEPLLEKLKTNSLQIQSLTQTRDTLLPKLISGQLEVV
jgi:type I restriction enzyme S subunit